MALDHFIREEATITDKDAHDTTRANMSKTTRGSTAEPNVSKKKATRAHDGHGA